MDLTHTVEFFKEPKTARVERTNYSKPERAGVL